MTWQQAYDHCGDDNAYLTEIKNDVENTIITEFVQYQHRSDPEYPLQVWLGLHAAADNKTFEWVPFNKPLSYSNWEPQAPDNWTGDQWCGALHTKYWDRVLKWNDLSCHKEFYAVCMKKKG